MPTPFQTPFGLPAWPRPLPETSPPSTPAATLGVALASEHGFAQWAANGRVLRGWADAQQGEATTGIARIRDGMAAAEATSTRVVTPLFLTLLAEALTLAGKIEEALAALDGALAKAAVPARRAGTQKFIACPASSPVACRTPIL